MLPVVGKRTVYFIDSLNSEYENIIFQRAAFPNGKKIHLIGSRYEAMGIKVGQHRSINEIKKYLQLCNLIERDETIKATLKKKFKEDLKKEDKYIQEESIQGFCSIMDESDIPFLVELMRDKQQLRKIREVIIWELGFKKYEEAIEPLFEITSKEYMTGSFLAIPAQISLAQIGSEKAIKTFIEAVKSPTGTFYGYELIKSTNATEIFIKLLDDDEDDIIFGALVLGNIGDPRAIEPLKKMLNKLENDPTGLPIIVEALYKLGYKEGVDILLNKVKSKSWEGCLLSATLREPNIRKDERVQQYLKETLKSKNELHRKEAEEILRSIEKGVEFENKFENFILSE